MVEKLTVATLLGFCQQVPPILRHLKETDTTMPYGVLARRIGLLPWPDVRFQLNKVLYACAATDRFSDAPEFDEDWGRFVVESTNKPGHGLLKRAHIVIEDAPPNTA
jgi:hypothetical protein